MWTLLPFMFERMAIIVTLAFLLTRFKPFRRTVWHGLTLREKWVLILIFGLFGIISTYTGITVEPDRIVHKDWTTGIQSTQAIANTRNIGITIGGLLGGPVVGLGIGLVAGIHRFQLGGLTGLACGTSAIAAGLLSGFLGMLYRRRSAFTALQAAAVGTAVEALEMAIILVLVKPYSAAVGLVELIGLPMIAVNGFGVWIFMAILQSVRREEERAQAIQTQKALLLADKTLPFFRQGLSSRSCKEASLIIRQYTGADAVSITDRERVLAHVGIGSDHHKADGELATELTREVLREGRIRTARSPEDIHCYYAGCPIKAALVLPLKVKGEPVGTLKLYFRHPSGLNTVQKELAEGLANLFSTQLELGAAEHQTSLLRDAEIKALQSQIHPHFFFNAINTIISVCRTDAMLARKLLINLAAFFRSNLQAAGHTLVTLTKELEHVDAYLSLEQARFPGKYTLHRDIDPEVMQVLVPPFTLQPLVENALKHAFPSARSEAVVTVTAHAQDGSLQINVSDNGTGIPEEKVRQLGYRHVISEQGTGTALWNIRERLLSLYGEEAEFLARSEVGKGTAIQLTVPIRREEA